MWRGYQRKAQHYHNTAFAIKGETGLEIKSWKVISLMSASLTIAGLYLAKSTLTYLVFILENVIWVFWQAFIYLSAASVWLSACFTWPYSCDVPRPRTIWSFQSWRSPARLPQCWKSGWRGQRTYRPSPFSQNSPTPFRLFSGSPSCGLSDFTLEITDVGRFFWLPDSMP